MKHTTIQITPETLEILKKYKIARFETYDEILNRFFKIIPLSKTKRNRK